jgi:hypothetical protein
MRIAIRLLVVAFVLGEASSAMADVAMAWAVSPIYPGPSNVYPTTVRVVSDAQFNSHDGSGVIITNTSKGLYTVVFPKLSTGHADLGNVQVVSLGWGTREYCNIDDWHLTVRLPNVTAHVQCFASDGTLADSQFVIYYLRGTNSYMLNPDATSPKVASFYSHQNQDGAPIEISRIGIGYYKVKFHQTFSGTNGQAFATAYGSNNHCQVTDCLPDGTVSVGCFAPDGRDIDAAFAVSVGEHGGLPSAQAHYTRLWKFLSSSSTARPGDSEGTSLMGFDSRPDDVDFYFIDHGDVEPGPMWGASAVFVNSTFPGEYCKPAGWYLGEASKVFVNCFLYSGQTGVAPYVEQLITSP